jgi:hypothetical protein
LSGRRPSVATAGDVVARVERVGALRHLVAVLDRAAVLETVTVGVGGVGVGRSVAVVAVRGPGGLLAVGQAVPVGVVGAGAAVDAGGRGERGRVDDRDLQLPVEQAEIGGAALRGRDDLAQGALAGAGQDGALAG